MKTSARVIKYARPQKSKNLFLRKNSTCFKPHICKGRPDINTPSIFLEGIGYRNTLSRTIRYLNTLNRTIPYLNTLSRILPYLKTLPDSDISWNITPLYPILTHYRCLPYLSTLRTIPYLITLSRTIPYPNRLSLTIPHLNTLSRTIHYLNTLNWIHSDFVLNNQSNSSITSLESSANQNWVMRHPRAVG